MVLRRKFNGAKTYTEAWAAYCLTKLIYTREVTPGDGTEPGKLLSRKNRKGEWALLSSMRGRGASYTRRSQSESVGGLYTSENAGMSSENYVRIIMAERLRF